MRPNESWQPTPGRRLSSFWSSLARRGCTLRWPSPLHTMRMALTIGLALACAALVGCAGRSWRAFALSSPGHLDDYRKLQDSLSDVGVQTREGPSTLGTASLLVESRQFDCAKEQAETIIARDALTLRVLTRRDAPAYEVWEDGRRMREETYQIHRQR